MTKTFAELAQDEAGTIYEDGYENGVRYLIMRGPAALCAYVGVPADHPLAGHSYDDLSLECHGGLTFGGEGGGKGSWPAGWYWYGWDYGHAGDKSFYDLKEGMAWRADDREWTVEDVQKEIWHVTYYFAKLVKLAEDIARKRGSA